MVAKIDYEIGKEGHISGVTEGRIQSCTLELKNVRII